MGNREEKIKELDLIWKQLNKFGIHTVEEAYAVKNKLDPLDISCMVAPVDWEKIREIQRNEKNKIM